MTLMSGPWESDRIVDARGKLRCYYVKLKVL